MYCILNIGDKFSSSKFNLKKQSILSLKILYTRLLYSGNLKLYIIPEGVNETLLILTILISKD